MNSKELYYRLLGYVRPYWKAFAISILATVVLSATQPLFPALLKPLLDGSFVDKDPRFITLMPILFVALFLVRGVASFISQVGISWVSTRVVMNLRSEMFDRLLALPSRYFDLHPTGNLISKITFNVSNVANTCTNALVVLVRDSLAVIGLLGWMFYLDWKLSLIFFIVVPTAALVIKAVSLRMRKLSRGLQDGMGDMTHTLEEAINGNQVIKIYGGQHYERERFGRINNSIRRYLMKIKVASAANVPVVELIAATALAVIVYVASVKSAQDQITVGGFVSFFAAMAMLFAPAKNLTKINEQLQQGLAAAETVFDLIDQPPEVDTGTLAHPQARGHLEFRHVSLAFDTGGAPALSGVNLEIRPGETVALVGPSGSGKTSLVNLVPRFYTPSSGAILLDGIDIHDILLHDLRHNIAIVSQDTMLFNDTIRANIAYGFPQQFREEEILAAARAAHVIEFAEKMPDGLDTLVGENGVLLSGGQRQRIAIARAFLKNAPILILDEATSALDNQSEYFIHDAMEEIRRNRTVIIIAHRLSTIRKADRILVLQNGQIVESGDHDSLMQRNGVYAALQQVQLPAN